MIELDNFNFDEEVAKFNDVIFNQSNEVKAKILTGYLSSIIDVEIKHFDDFKRAFKILCQPNWLEFNYIIEPAFKVNR
ncbi:hypothetical protein ACEWX4_05740 [Acinetobacter indicus]|uniref:hypothetical protein n=1 Tax=Acinetobacter indicus TaxID=756892 RepID=UPI0035BC3DE1